LGEQVPEEEIKILLEAAIRAPSACSRQIWRYVIVRNPETIKVLSQAGPYSTQNQTFVKKAPLILVFCADLRPHK
jgi:nitroreductase